MIASSLAAAPACECFRHEFGTPLDMRRAAFVIVLSTDMHDFSLQNLRLLSQPFVSSTEDIQQSRYELLLEVVRPFEDGVLSLVM
jgi:hypothetical protein